MARESRGRRRSGCPVSVSLDVLGDRWSLLIVRDLMVRGYQTFGEFLQAGESIATNILAERLERLTSNGLVIAEHVETDGRRVHYRLTEKGIDLAPVVLELLIWAARNEKTGAPCEVVEAFARDREGVIAEVRRRWHERDRTPFLPKFKSV